MDSKRLFTLIGSWMILSCILVDHAAEGFIQRRGSHQTKKKHTSKQQLLAMEMAKFTALLLVCKCGNLGSIEVSGKLTTYTTPLS